ncbi:MAG: DUF5947 family protein [Ktedonobacteraceae bacterium]
MSSFEPTNSGEGRSAPSLDVLRQFTRKREMRPPTEQCELCSAGIPAQHRHLLALASHTLICVCIPCSILFGDPGAGQGKYRLVPSRALLLPDFQMTDEQWEELLIPVNMVYTFTAQAPGVSWPTIPVRQGLWSLRSPWKGGMRLSAIILS